MNIFDTYDEPSGARVVSAQETSANIIPPEHLVHTSFFAECSKAQDKAAFDIALSKLPHRDINHRDNKGKTPLIYTAEHGFAYGMQKLLEIKADASICDENGHNALYHATQMLHKECMQLLAEDSGIDSST
jgi:hypothetical protein